MTMIATYREASTVDELATVLSLFLEDSQDYCVSRSEIPGGHELHANSGDGRPNVVIRVLDHETMPSGPDA